MRTLHAGLHSVCRGHEKPRIPRTRRTSLVKRRESSTGRRSSRASSCGSWVQPSIGMPFAICTTRSVRNRAGPQRYQREQSRTFVYAITNRRVVYETDPREILLDNRQVLAVRTVWKLCA